QEWQAWIPAEQVWQVWLSAQPVQALVQQPLLQTSPVQLQQQADCAYISDLSQAQLQSTVGCCVLVDPGRQDLLFMMHEKSTVQEKCVYRHTCSQQRKETRVTKYQKILQNEKTADVAAAERCLGAGSCIKPNLKLFEEYLVAQAEVAADLTRHYNEIMCNQQDGTTTPKVPLHRKLRLSAYINHQRANQLLINCLKKRFSQDAIFILGNWSASMTQFHEPICGKGWQTLLKRGRFDIYLIDKYLTSKTCPNCNGQLSNTHYVPNPRPFQRRIQPEVKCHGLLSCQSEKCVEFFKTYDDKRGYLGKKECEKKDQSEGNFQRKLWNRDLVAVLNFRHILFSLRETGTVPTRFQRGQPIEAPKTPKAPKTRRALKTRKTSTARKTHTASTAPATPNPTNPTIPSS
ncbi:hypothetical protein H4S00_003280, partial [Coemansia sp. D1744]